MIAAIYARKSTEQGGISDEAKSVIRQIEHARAYAAPKGWTVDERFIFSDDGISDAEFARRKGLMQLLGSLKPKPAFQVLIMSEESRIHRGRLLHQATDWGERPAVFLLGRSRAHPRQPDRKDHAAAPELRRRDGTRTRPATHLRRDGPQGQAGAHLWRIVLRLSQRRGPRRQRAQEPRHPHDRSGRGGDDQDDFPPLHRRPRLYEHCQNTERRAGARPAGAQVERLGRVRRPNDPVPRAVQRPTGLGRHEEKRSLGREEGAQATQDDLDHDQRAGFEDHRRHDLAGGPSPAQERTRPIFARHRRPPLRQTGRRLREPLSTVWLHDLRPLRLLDLRAEPRQRPAGAEVFLQLYGLLPPRPRGLQRTPALAH